MQEVKKPIPEVQALLDQARQLNAAGKWDQALALLDQALSKAQELKDRKGEADALRGQGVVLLQVGQVQKALEAYQRALALFRTLGDKASEAALLHNIGKTYRERSQPQTALEYYALALPMLHALGNKMFEAIALNNTGIAYSDLRQWEKALESFNQSLVLIREIGDKAFEADALNGIGSIYSDLGQFQKALEFYNQALPLYRASGDQRGEAVVRFNIGNIYSSTGQLQKALEFYRLCLPVFRTAGDKVFEADVLNAMGNIHGDLRESKQARESWEQALALFQRVGDKNGEAGVLVNLGLVYRAISLSAKALAFFQQALPLLRASGNKVYEANALNGMGRVYLETGQTQKAEVVLGQALLLQRAVRNASGEASVLTDIAFAEEKLKRPADAEAHYGQAVALFETLRENLGGLSEAKSAFLGSKLNTYYHYLQLLLKQGKTEKAFEIAQKTKARSLLDLMASGRVDLNAELTPEERQSEQALRQKASALNQQLVKEGVQNEVGAKTRFAALQEELKQTESQLQTLTDTLYSRHPGLAQKRVAKTATLAEIAKLLPADTALLEYIVLSQDKLALFIVTRGAVQALTLPLAYKSLASKASAFRAACADPRKDYKAAAAELYTLLLAPTTKHLTGVKRLVLCPDGALWDVPFQALFSSGQFLAQRYEIAYAYSATGAQAALTVKVGRKKPTGTLLALANPDFGSSTRFGDLESVPGQRPIDAPSRPIDAPSRPIDAPSRPIDAPSRAFDSVSRAGKIVALPGTQREADALAKLFPSATLLKGKNAQEGKAKQVASQYRYLHFATHGFFNDASPLLSSLVLAQPSTGSKDDGFLTAREIFDLDLSAEMVVLSACNTARGVQRTGDGVIGLTWALFVAGCPTQVVSQWSVDDASTATLMTRFYGNLAKGKTGKGAALRQASLSLMQDPKHAHPYYWAPFVLMGDWR